MDRSTPDEIEERRRYIEGWNETMVDIWREQIYLLGVVDTGALYRSVEHLDIILDKAGRYIDFTLSHMFLEYGLWQDLGTGRNVAIGNTHRKDMDEWENKRVKRRWFSTKHYSSVMRLKDFMATSIGKEYVGLFSKLEAEDYRSQTAYYKSKGLS